MNDDDIQGFEDLLPQGKQMQQQPQAQRGAGGDNDIAGFEDLLPKQNSSSQSQSTAMDMIDSFNAKVSNLSTGALQGITKVMSAVGVDTAQFQEKLSKVNATYQKAGEEARQRSPKATIASDIAGDITNQIYTTAASGGLGIANPSASVAGRMAQQGTVAAAEGGLEYGTGEERLKRGAAGYLLGAAGQGAAEGVGYLAKKGAQALFKKPVQEAADLLNAGGQTTAGVATGSEALERAEGYLSQLPIIGAKGNYKKIAKNVNQQTKDFIESQGMQVSEDGIEGVSRESLATAVVSDAKVAEKAARATASKAYAEAQDFAMQNNIPVKLSSTKELADNLLQENSNLTKEGFDYKDISSSPVGKMLKNISDSGEISATRFEALRQDIKAFGQDAATGKLDSSLTPVLKQMGKAMDNDLMATGEAIGGEYNKKLMNARDTYTKLVAPFKDNAVLDNMVNSTKSVDNKLKEGLVANAPNTAKTIMSNLTDEGKEKYGQALILNAAEKSFKSGSGEFDANLFNKSVKRMGETLNALPESTLTKLKGLQKIISSHSDILKEAGKKGFVVPGLSADIGFRTLGTVGAFVASPVVKGISWALTNPKMVRQLVRLGGGQLNKTTEKETIRQIIKNILKKSAIPTAASTGARNLEEGGYLDSINNQESFGKGNINLLTRPKVKNSDGSISTVRSMSFNEDGKEILIPTVSDEGKIMSEKEAIANYHKTGKYLGKFDSIKEANDYAVKLHNEQANIYAPNKKALIFK